MASICLTELYFDVVTALRRVPSSLCGCEPFKLVKTTRLAVCRGGKAVGLQCDTLIFPLHCALGIRFQVNYFYSCLPAASSPPGRQEPGLRNGKMIMAFSASKDSYGFLSNLEWNLNSKLWPTNSGVLVSPSPRKKKSPDLHTLLANFRGVNILTMVNFKLPMQCPPALGSWYELLWTGSASRLQPRSPPPSPLLATGRHPGLLAMP